jgi:hypothetical protein
MNKKIVIPSLLILLVVGCKGNLSNSNVAKNDNLVVDSALSYKNDSILIHSKNQGLEQELKEIMPDSTINKTLLLRNNESLERFYKNFEAVTLLDEVRESPVAIFSNKDASQYLLVYQYEGDIKNSFSCFEIGYFKNDVKLMKQFNYSTYDNVFATESNLMLGITLEEIVKIKGSSYESKNVNNEQIITYRINDYDKSSFLKKYNMPGYFMEFILSNNKVIKIIFGFDYP